MIRFNCPHCNREYQLPAVLAHLPLLCKGCGQSVTAPKDAVDEPEPREELKPPPPPPAPVPVAAPPPKPAPRVVPPKRPPEPDEESDEPLLLAEPDERPVPVPAPKREAPPPPPDAKPVAELPGAVRPTAPAARGNLIPVVVDVAVGLVALAVGVFAGEMLCGKSTARVWHDAGGAVEFPPTELLMWAAAPLLVLLVYALLLSRALSVGWWLHRRAA